VQFRQLHLSVNKLNGEVLRSQSSEKYVNKVSIIQVVVPLSDFARWTTEAVETELDCATVHGCCDDLNRYGVSGERV
jgi:hypothetical protein